MRRTKGKGMKVSAYFTVEAAFVVSTVCLTVISLIGKTVELYTEVKDYSESCIHMDERYDDLRAMLEAERAAVKMLELIREK